MNFQKTTGYVDYVFVRDSRCVGFTLKNRDWGFWGNWTGNTEVFCPIPFKLLKLRGITEAPKEEK